MFCHISQQNYYFSATVNLISVNVSISSAYMSAIFISIVRWSTFVNGSLKPNVFTDRGLTAILKHCYNRNVLHKTRSCKCYLNSQLLNIIALTYITQLSSPTRKFWQRYWRRFTELNPQICPSYTFEGVRIS